MWHILLPCLFLLHSLLVHAYSNNNLINRANAHDRLHRVHPSRLPSVLSYAEQKEYDNDGIHLALSPSCGTVGRTGEVNTGIDWQSIKTVVAFGDSVGNGGDGSPPAPVRFLGKNPSAGGRHTNGETWIEQLLHLDRSSGQERMLLSYAQSGATTDKQIWESRKWSDDFPLQLERLYANGTYLNLDPVTTLYVGYFGINDYWSINADGDKMRLAGRRAATLLSELHQTTRAQNVLWLGVQFSTPSTVAYNDAIYSGLVSLHRTDPQFNFAYVDTGRFFSAIHESFEMFGYTSSKHCLRGQRSSVEDECKDPERTVYYMGAHPSRQTHRILAEYVMAVMKGCYNSDDEPFSPLNYDIVVPNPLHDYITTAHLFFAAILVVSVLVYRPLMKSARKIGYGMGAIVLTSPRQQ